ncbi:MAG: hypothetical protein WBX15_12535 [Thermoanaerobaculia bacterium]
MAEETEFSALSAFRSDFCKVYRDLEFPGDVYEHIEEYHEQKDSASE